jgi:HSP20 family protein
MQTGARKMAHTDMTKTTASIPQRHNSLFDVMRADMDRLLERFESGWPHLPAAFRGAADMLVPELDVCDEGKQLVIETDLPGVDEKDVTVTLTTGVLTIKGQKKAEHEEKNGNYYMAERSFGLFERSVRLPDMIDDSKVEARFNNGVLKITVQKKPEAVMAEKKIEIKKG